ncbi:SDR family oxidoreductase [bacterium]|jgi:NAD(P)-dependent dehydrogenase (short-subunit alcohol dehydrogenase family)|nr:SDR family oxidoreductase [bacterium]|tara:strand:+ start:6183 stop:6947 length:765 start_codon:yes stop_codon:yes gene_type:complete
MNFQKYFKDKTVLVTGSGRGIGLEITKEYLEHGAKVIAIDLNIQKLLKFENKFQNKILIEKLDLSNLEDFQDYLKKLPKNFKNINILINNAGMKSSKNLIETDMDDLNNLINFNSIKVIEISRILMNFSLKKNKGKIINIGSSLSSHGAVFRTQGGGSDYSVTKSMVHIITKIMAYECAKFKINVNAIAPGIIQTPMHDRPMHVTEKKHLDKIPLERIGLPKDISGTALFLGSNYSSYITGQIIHINGGMLMIG